MMVKSQKEETIYNPGDKSIIGNKTPRYQFGITVGFDYKNFDFEMFWQGTGKRDYMLSGAQFWGFTSQWMFHILRPLIIGQKQIQMLIFQDQDGKMAVTESQVTVIYKVQLTGV